MTATSAATQNFVQPSCTARDPRVAAAVESVAPASFSPLVAGDREMPVEATVRMLEDLNVTEESRVLVVEPFSGYLPELLGRLASEVTAVCADPVRAESLRTQLADAGAANVHVQTFLQNRGDDDRGFDRMVIMQPANEELGPVLQGLLSEHGRAVWSLDKSMPPRRLRRLLHVGASITVEEDLDLVHYMPLLGDMLVDRGVALRQEVVEAVTSSRSSGQMLGQELLERGSVREVDLYAVLAEQQGFTSVSASDVLSRIDGDLVRQLPRKYLDYYQFLPVCEADGKVWVVTPDVNLPVDEVRSVFDDAEVICELICPTDLQRVWTVLELGVQGRFGGGVASAPGVQPQLAADPFDLGAASSAGTATSAESSSAAGAATADTQFDEILTDAIALGASDVHIEPNLDGARVRYRVHGRMHVAPRELSPGQLAAITATVEQATSATWMVNGSAVALLARTHRTVAGTSITVNVMATAGQSRSLAELGLSEDVAAAFGNALNQPRGLILVAGPTRSGRSTTLRATTEECAADAARKVVAVVGENVVPVPFVATTRAADGGDADADVDVAAAVREALQQNADVLQVDAASGAETIAELMRAASRGHLVVAATEGNDFQETLQGLVDAGITSNAIASNVAAVMVQHLARRNCSHCRVATSGSAKLAASVLPNELEEPADHFECSGCQHCNHTGFSGQVPIVEFVPNSSALRAALRRGVAPHDLAAIARQNGLQSLRDSAVALLSAGEISLAELGRVLTEEQREGACGCRSTGTCS